MIHYLRFVTSDWRLTMHNGWLLAIDYWWSIIDSEAWSMMIDAAWYLIIRDAWWINEYHSNDGDDHDDAGVIAARYWPIIVLMMLINMMMLINHLHDDHNHFGLDAGPGIHHSVRTLRTPNAGRRSEMYVVCQGSSLQAARKIWAITRFICGMPHVWLSFSAQCDFF